LGNSADRGAKSLRRYARPDRGVASALQVSAACLTNIEADLPESMLAQREVARREMPEVRRLKI